MRYLLFLLLSFCALSAFSQTLIVGGGGICHTNGDPDLNVSLATQDQRYECLIAWDWVAKKLYVYRASDPSGSRWDEFTGGGGGTDDTRVDTAFVSADTLRLVVRDLSDLSTVKTIKVPLSELSEGGTVTSVGLVLPAEFSVTVTPITTTGSLTAIWANQTANKIFASPDGTTGVPAFRALVAADIPSLLASQISDFTEAAQDAALGVLADGNTVNFTYNDGGNSATAEVITQMSLTSDASGLKLSGDQTSPGNLKLYGTNGSGVKGWYAQPAGSSGTVTDFIFTNGGGFTGTVTTSTTTPTLSLVLQNAAADATTKGQSTYTAADFNSSSGLISIDYTNGQVASGSQPGFLSAANWTTFNGKIGGTLTTGYLPKASGTSTLTDSKIFETSNTISIGTATPDAFSRLFLSGGAQGANADARGVTGAATDQAVWEVQGADYATTFRSAWIKYTGVSFTNTTTFSGVSVRDLGELTFQDPAAAIIRSITNVPIRVGVNDVEQMRFTSSGLEARTGNAVRFRDSDNSDYVGFVAPALSASTTYTLPATSSNGVLTNTAGVLSWAASGGTGTVTDFSAGDLSPLFTTSEATTTTTPALTFSASSAAQNAVLAGPATGGAGAYSFRALVVADIPTLTSAQLSDFVEAAQDATGAMVDANTLVYTDGTPLLAVKTQMSITSDGSGLKLSGDSGTPGNLKLYGTNGSGTKGWYDQSTGTVTNFSAGDLSPLFTTTESTTTTTPALSFSLSNAAANTYFGNATASPAGPSHTAAGALTKTDDTNVTATLGGNPSTSLLRDASITLGWTGTLAVSRGGIGVGTITGLMQGNGTSAVTGITNSSTVGQTLRVTGASTYAWGALDLANSSATTGDLPFASLAQGSALSVLGVAGNATADNASIAAASDNQVLRRNGTTLGFGAINLSSTSAVTSVLDFGNGGTGLNALGTANQMIRVNAGATALEYFTPTFTGTVTTVSVVTANGLAGSVANATTTPAITLSTTITGMLKGNGTAISAGTAGTDYSAGTSALATGILKSTTTTGALTIAVAGDFPTLNQNTTGTAANVTGTVAIANGGTGQTTQTAAFDALDPLTTLGDLLIHNGTNSVRFAGNTTTTKKFLNQTGNGTVSASPSWDALTSGDIPALAYVTSVATSQPAAGLTITGGPITSAGTFTFALANDLLALEGLSSTGLAARTGTDTWAQRTITGTTNRISVTNGSGASGNPTLDISSAYVGQATITTLGTIGTGTWQADVVNPTYGGTGLNALGTSLQQLRVNVGGTALEYFTPSAGSGTVTSVSVVSANGFAGSVATATTTPAITISTTITGLLKGNGTAISAATQGTDYYAPGGTDVAVADGGTGASTLTGILQGNGTSAVTTITNSTTVGQVLRVTGSNTYGFGAVDLADADAITSDLPLANLTQGTARSVLGVTGNATADYAAIQGTANQVLVVNSGGTALAFGQVNLASSSAVTGVLAVANGGAPAGTTGQTLRYSGTTLTATSYLSNDGTTIGVNGGTLGRLAVSGMTGGAGISVTGTPSSFGAQFYGSSSVSADSYYGFDFENTATSGNVLYTMRNLGTTTSSNAIAQISTPHGAGDPFLQFSSTGAGGNTWSVGLDNDDGDAFGIAPTTVLGSTTALKLSQAGQLFLPGGYGSHTFTGTPATFAAYTATGAVIELTDAELVTELGGTGSAPLSAEYVVTALTGSLPSERLIVASDNMTSWNTGANGKFSFAADIRDIRWRGDIAPTAISGTNNNYSPAGLDTTSTLNLTASGPATLTGLVPGASAALSDGRMMTVNNLDSSDPITFVAESASSTGANRFNFRNDIVLEAGESLLLQYSSAKAEWRLIGKSSTSDPSVITSSSITTNQDDYTPTGWTAATNVRLNITGGLPAITGFAADTPGEEKTLTNVGTNACFIPGENPSSTAVNRVATGRDFILLPGKSCRILYDGTVSRWRILDDMNLGGADGNIQFYEYNPGSVTAGDQGDIGFSIPSGTFSAQNAASGFPGSADANTGTSTTGLAAAYFPKTVNSFALFNAAHMNAFAWVSIPTLSNATDRFTFQFVIAANSSGTTLAQNNAVGIRYSDNINSGVLEGYTRNNAGTETTVSLGATVSAGGLMKLRIEIDAAEAEARFYVNETYAGRITATMPAAGTACGSRIGIFKSAGTTSRLVHIHRFNTLVVYP